MKGMPSVNSTLNNAEETQAVSAGMKHFTSLHGGAGRFVASRESHRLRYYPEASLPRAFFMTIPR